jgi:FlaA1/EpsC-like NDP-sugar epimerase
VKILPNLGQMLGGGVGKLDIQDVSIEDLLGREAVSLDQALIRSFIAERCVMVTGAGGSIGSEICRQVSLFRPKSLLLVERSEFALFQIERELSRVFPHLQIEPLICDICDETRVERIVTLYKPEVVFHAAAHKHVPMMESNPGEAVKNNIFGTYHLGRLAKLHGVKKFVFVSTDKAVNPTSVMGASKRVAEMLLLGLGRTGPTKFVAVRFGNVLGSAGSVIPIFKEQIANGGPVTVTHPEMRRYFMTIPEASQLVLQAGAMGHGGEIFVLDMGEPMKIIELARQLILLSGLTPGIDIDIEITGVRPGEKLFEELGFAEERMTKTEHQKIFIGRMSLENGILEPQDLKLLESLKESSDRLKVRAVLKSLVPEMMEEEPAKTGTG